MQPPASGPPIVTLTTDFGWDDSYVAEMKAVLWRWAPEARIVDVTHSIPPQDVMASAFVLGRLVAVYPKGSIHVAVVDPGVGSQRRPLVATIDERLIVCPDNGLITWAMRLSRRTFEACEITWRPSGAGGLSRTFHGRDLFAPVAGMLARDPAVLGTIARTITDPVLLPVTLAAKPLSSGTVVHIDHFGNAVTNVNAELLSERPGARVILGEQDVGLVRQTYFDVAEGQAVALLGSSGMLEIAVRNASAAQRFGIHIGDVVKFV
jgi:S-adenosylmethionine hydrolase